MWALARLRGGGPLFLGGWPLVCCAHAWSHHVGSRAVLCACQVKIGTIAAGSFRVRACWAKLPFEGGRGDLLGEEGARQGAEYFKGVPS